MTTDPWEFFCDLGLDQQLYLLKRSEEGFNLDDDLWTLINRKTLDYKRPENDEKLWDEAGKFADSYRGGGWFEIRNLLANFVKHCRPKK